MNTDYIRQPASWLNRQHSTTLSGMLALIAVGLLVSGCSKPTEATRDNRRLLDAILTAVSIRNSDELAKDKKLLDERRDSGQLSDESYSEIRGIIELAEAGDWTSAEEQLYDLREQVPFPK